MITVEIYKGAPINLSDCVNIYIRLAVTAIIYRSNTDRIDTMQSTRFSTRLFRIVDVAVLTKFSVSATGWDGMEKFAGASEEAASVS